jgi:hypothetical protein
MGGLSTEMNDEKTSVAKEILRRRYEECDSQGHLEPLEAKNICNYCYRHLEYEISEINQRESDKLIGIEKIINELHPA